MCTKLEKYELYIDLNDTYLLVLHRDVKGVIYGNLHPINYTSAQTYLHQILAHRWKKYVNFA